MDVLTCDEVRAHLGAYHDGELPVRTAVAVTAHLEWCRSCADEARTLAAIGEALRSWAAARAAAAPAPDRLAPALVSRLTAEQTVTWRARVAEVFNDLHVLWAGLAAAAVTAATVLALGGLVSLAVSQRSDSLSALLTALATPGSNANPVRPDERVRLPRVEPDTVLPAVLLTPTPARDEALVALAAVVTREGRVADLEVLLASPSDRRLLLDVLAAAAAARFEPAQVAGSPVAVNLVWLLGHTRVRGRPHG